MQRRALAMQMSGIATFKVPRCVDHQAFRTHDEASLPRLQQLVDADKTLWMLVGQEVRGENLVAGSPLPIDHAISLLQDSPSACCLGSPVTEGISARPPVQGPQHPPRQRRPGKGKEGAEEEEKYSDKVPQQGEASQESKVRHPEGSQNSR